MLLIFLLHMCLLSQLGGTHDVSLEGTCCTMSDQPVNVMCVQARDALFRAIPGGRNGNNGSGTSWHRGFSLGGIKVACQVEELSSIGCKR